MALQFSQEEVEGALAVSMPHGCRVDIARISGLGESYLKRQFNPDDETPSCAFKTLQVVCALDDINPELGDEFWETLTRMRELSKTRRPKKVADLAEETGKLNKEISEFVMAKLKDAPIEKQLDELADVERQLAKVKEDLIQEFDRLQKKQRQERLRAVN